MAKAEISFEIVENIGVLSTSVFCFLVEKFENL